MYVVERMIKIMKIIWTVKSLRFTCMPHVVYVSFFNSMISNFIHNTKTVPIKPLYYEVYSMLYVFIILSQLNMETPWSFPPNILVLHFGIAVDVLVNLF